MLAPARHSQSPELTSLLLTRHFQAFLALERTSFRAFQASPCFTNSSQTSSIVLRTSISPRADSILLTRSKRRSADANRSFRIARPRTRILNVQCHSRQVLRSLTQFVLCWIKSQFFSAKPVNLINPTHQNRTRKSSVSAISSS